VRLAAVPLLDATEAGPGVKAVFDDIMNFYATSRPIPGTCRRLIRVEPAGDDRLSRRSDTEASVLTASGLP